MICQKEHNVDNVLTECENAVMLSFDVAALSVQNLVVTFEHPHSASLVTGISSSLSSLLLFVGCCTW